jgi:hypothetical protein
MKKIICLLGVILVLVKGQKFICPDPTCSYCTYEDVRQCDKYYECYDGIVLPKDPGYTLCPDGLVFDPYSRGPNDRCDHYFNVDCGDRLELQPPKGPNDLCPRLNGFYAHPDPAVCNIFYSCVEGNAEEYTCSPGLWFDEYQGVCNWPSETDRKNCQVESQALESGFRCAASSPTDDAFGVSDPHPKYADPADCAKFYICLNGVTPREQGCELGLVFNTITGQCDSPDNVPECKDYYAFLNEEEEDKRKQRK